MKISQILDKIDENQLFVPAFQREYVWKRDDAKKLVSSLIKEYPTGTMLTWETNFPPELKGKWQYDSKQGSVKLILDGQQRITTLYMLLRGEVPPYYTKNEITHDTRNLYVNIENLDLQYYKPNYMQNNPCWINVTDIFKRNIRERDVIRSIETTGRKLERSDEDVISDNFKALEKIPDREFIEQSIPIKASLKEAIDIFYIVNASGVNLTDAELALAQISGYWPKARETFKKKLAELKSNGFDFNLDFVVYCLLGIMHNLGSDMTKLHGSENAAKLKDVWGNLESTTLDYCINLLRSHAYVDHSKEINSVYALVPIIVFIYNKGANNLSHPVILKIVKWFYYSQIRQRYVSQLPQKLDKDIGIIVHSDNPFDDLLTNIKLERPLEISAEEFVGVDIRNALFNLMRWYFKSKNAICFTTGLTIRKNMGSKYSLEWDHIFPYSVLKENGYSQTNRFKYALAQEITNRAVLTATANRGKGNTYADEYLSNVKLSFPKALELQCIPDDSQLWKLQNYEAFLQNRRELLAKKLNEFLNNITNVEETPTGVSIDELILEGETNELEFKSSLRWDYQENRVDKKLEQVVTKTIAAFGNSEGGTLLIGIADDSTVLGLDKDYSSLSGDKDEFELHLTNLLNKSFDKPFVASNIRISFPLIEGIEICQIDIAKAQKPLFLETIDKNDQKIEKFYVRCGNSSQEMKMSESNEYIKTRF